MFIKAYKKIKIVSSRKIAEEKFLMGFTLLELLVVIAIIGILAAVVLVSLNSSRDKASNARTEAQIREYLTALDLYYSDNGEYPVSVQELGTSHAYDCLGQYGPLAGWVNANECWYEDDLSGNKTVGTLSALGPYMPTRPEGHIVAIPNNRIRGERYIAKCGHDGYRIEYMLIGQNQTCALGITGFSGPQGKGFTRCFIEGGDYEYATDSCP